MPLPSNSFTLRGGCNCGSIRYRISVPALEKRPAAPYHTPTASAEVRAQAPKIPCVLLDHCNDCRRATASVVPICLVTDAGTVEVSFRSPSHSTDASHGTSRRGEDGNRAWIPLEPILALYEHSPDSTFDSTKDTSLGHYISSAGRHRWFCTKCGTPIAYHVTYSAYPEAWASTPRMFDIWLGTLDREDLEYEWMRPDHAVWCVFGIPWVADMVKTGARKVIEGNAAETEPLPRHPLFMVDQPEDEDIREWLKILGKV
jgi:hypothetical protein